MGGLAVFGKSTTHRGEGDYEIPYTQYLHEETFKRDYVIELEKQCSETGKLWKTPPLKY